MKTSLALALVLSATSFAASAQQYVSGYTKADGTYVQGYYRSTPNNTKLDNYSTRGNVNPYTGQQGTINPYTQPTYTPPVRSVAPSVPVYTPLYTPTYTQPATNPPVQQSRFQSVYGQQQSDGGGG